MILSHRTQFGFDARKVSARLGQRMRASIGLCSESVTQVIESSWLVERDSTNCPPYVVRQCTSSCHGRTGSEELCEAFQRCGGCRHMYSCTCADATAGGHTCKHILLVLRVLGIWKPNVSSDQTFGMISQPQSEGLCIKSGCEQECNTLMTLVQVGEVCLYRLSANRFFHAQNLLERSEEVNSEFAQSDSAVVKQTIQRATELAKSSLRALNTITTKEAAVPQLPEPIETRGNQAKLTVQDYFSGGSGSRRRSRKHNVLSKATSEEERYIQRDLTSWSNVD